MSWLQKLPPYWQSTHVVTVLLWPLELAYRLILFIRKQFYTLGIFKSHRVKATVIVVGNVVVGGAGKTPVVLGAVQHLLAKQVPVGIISRGFGRTQQKTVLIRPHTAQDHQASEVGDEPLWLARRTACPVAVGANRNAALQCLMQAYPKLRCVVSDDGLQHHHLQRDLEWLVFDERGAGNQQLLPKGPLREPLTKIYSVDAIVASNVSPTTLAEKMGSQADHRWHGAKVYIQGFMQHIAQEPGQTATMLTPSQAVQEWSKKINNVRAFAGLGNPYKWFHALNALGLNLAEHQTTALPDHFNYPKQFCDQFDEAILITTEKDAVKLPYNPRLWVAIVAVELPTNLLYSLDEALRHGN